MHSTTRFLLGMFSLSSFYMIASHHAQPAIAQCLQADVSLQYNISGSRQPTRRSNDVTMEGEDGCVGNTSVTTGVQGNIGGSDPVEQHRQVVHRQTNGGKGNGFGGKPVQVKVNVPVDVYNPADDPQFMNRFR